MKKSFWAAVCIIIAVSLVGTYASCAKTRVMKSGDYVKFGKYMGEPVLWKCMKKDKNGPMLLSEYIISFKAFDAAESGRVMEGKSSREKFGSSEWNGSNIREWLNSKDKKVVYSTTPPASKAVWDGNGYQDEPGFLTNFTKKELSLIKPVKHEGVTDSVYLMSLNELFDFYKMGYDSNDCWMKNMTGVLKKNTKLEFDDMNSWWWLRTGFEDVPGMVWFIDKGGRFTTNDPSTVYAYEGMGGVVPALNLKSDKCMSGSGTRKDPYIIK